MHKRLTVDSFSNDLNVVAGIGSGLRSVGPDPPTKCLLQMYVHFVILSTSSWSFGLPHRWIHLIHFSFENSTYRSKVNMFINCVIIASKIRNLICSSISYMATYISLFYLQIFRSLMVCDKKN